MISVILPRSSGSIERTRSFEFSDNNVIDCKIFIIRVLIQSSPHSHRQRSIPRTRQRYFTAHWKALLRPEAVAATNIFAFCENNAIFGPARLAIDRNIRVLVVPRFGGKVATVSMHASPTAFARTRNYNG